MKKIKIHLKLNGIGLGISFWDYGFDLWLLCFLITYSDSQVGHFGDLHEITKNE